MTLAVFVTIAKCYKSVFLQHLMQTNVARNPEKLGYAKQNVPKIAEEKCVTNANFANFWKIINECCKRQILQKKPMAKPPQKSC